MEAHATLRTAQERAQEYGQLFDNVSGFRLGTGWYALALGPFAERGDANALRIQLQGQGLVPRDAFVAGNDGFGQRFWPVGAMGQTPATAAADPAPEADLASAMANLAAEAARVIVPEPEPEPAPEPEPQPEPEETLAQARQSEARLSRDERAELQIALQWKGFYAMAIDAAFGPGTRNSMRGWQADRGHEPTGVLTTRQRDELISAYRAELAALGFDLYRDDTAGIELELPLAMVRFDRYEAPFVHFAERDGSGLRVLLLSQEGNQATLFGLYEIMQTLEIVPIEGFRERRTNSFVLTGQNESLRSHAFARLQNGQIKGYMLIWDPAEDDTAARVLDVMENSFATFGGTLNSTVGTEPSATQRHDLISGLEVRRPERSRSGFFVDSSGRVLTTSEVVGTCERVTIDETHEAEVALLDTQLGIALLRPTVALAPLAHARFLDTQPRLMSEIAVAGYSYEDLLSRPILTYGQLADLRGLGGEVTLRRLSISVEPGDAGGPVFDGSGAVLGMLLPREQGGGRVLPEDVNFAANAEAIISALSSNGVRPVLSNGQGDMAPEQLTVLAADMTVLVSCWN